MPPMTSLADVVRKAIATPSSCSPTTSATLQALLTPAQDPIAKPTKTTTTRNPAPTRTTRTKTASNATADTTTTLTSLERYKLATEVVNVSLRVLTDATKTSPSSPSQSPKAKKTPLSGLTTIAECARIAFSHLRSARSATDESLQLEKGMLALSSKLVALGMDTLAMKELCKLKACLHKRSGGASLPATSDKGTLAMLLNLECRTSDADVISLAISFHLTVIRLIVKLGTPATVEASLPYLLLDNDISAASLVLRYAEHTKDKTRAATQLDAISKLILSICPSPSASMDRDAQSLKTCASPDTVFKLQTTALLMQTRWWPLAGHKADLSKELHEPLTRYLDAYRRRAGNGGPQAYNQAIDRVKALVDLDQPKSFGTTSLPVALYRSLSGLAESFGMEDEALRHTNSMSSVSEHTLDSSSTLLCTIRSMALHLHRDNHADLASIRNQLQSCKSKMKSNKPSDLPADELLVELTKLRKITIKLLTSYSNQQTTAEIDGQLSSLCETAFLCTDVLLWCLESKSESKPSGDIAPKLVSPFVSSSILACKFLLASHDHVKIILRALEVCTGLIDLDLDVEAEHLVVHISNWLWRCFQLLDSASAEPSLLAIRCLQASVSVLRDRSPAYQEAGFLAAKLEKLGSISKSCSIFAECIRVQLQSGVLRELAQDASQKPLSIFFQTRPKAQLLKRNLHEYHTAAAKDKESISFFDNVSTGLLERATLLEIQLAFFEEDLFKPSHRRRITTDLQQLCNRILDLYDGNEYPLRRARVCARVLRYSNEFPGLIDESIKDIAMTSQVLHDSLGQDSGLEPYAIYLRTSLLLTQAFQSNEASVENITELTKALSSLSKTPTDWEAIVNKVDDVDILVSELQFAASFLAMKGKDGPCLEALQALSHIHHLRPILEPSAVLQNSSQLALQYLRLGYSTEACRIIDSEDALSNSPDVPEMAKLEWHLAKTEIWTALGRIHSATKSIASATECIRSFPTVDHTTRLQAQILRAQFAFVCSLYSRSIGQIKQAMVYAKRYVSACQGTLSFLETQYAPQGNGPSSAVTTSQEELVKAVDKLAISETGSETISETEPITRQGAAYSLILPHLLNSFLHLSDMYAHQGLRPEASYYLDQADVLVSRVGVSELRTRVLVQRQAQAYVEGIVSDDPIEQNEIVDSINLVKLGIARGDTYAIDEETWENAKQEYEKAESMATRLASKSFIDKLEAVKAQPDKGPVIKAATVRATKRAVTKTLAAKVPPIKATKSISTKSKVVTNTAVFGQENVPLSSLCAAALRQRGLLLVNQGETDLGLELLKRADLMKYDSAQEILQQLAMAEGLLRKFGDELALDFTFNVLPESTISYPALSTITGKKPAQNLLPPNIMSPTNATTPKKINRQKRADDEFAQFLCEAQERLVTMQRRSASTAGMSVFHHLCGLGSKAMLLLSAINANMSLSGALHPTRAACSIEMSRIEATSRELSTIEAEKDFTNHDLAIRYASQENNGHLSAARFQKEYVDIIPSSWTAVSLTLSEDHNELYIVRYRANQAPFLLRLPMTRNKMQDIEDDEESPTFDFESGKAELQEIIELSNYTCSKPPSATTLEARHSWWEEREALDLRMQELIVNIENIWLGGFKGVLSQHRKDSSLLARFRKTLDSILDRHLPSRQGTKSKAKKLVLDSNIVELFVGLGDDHDGEVDMDEQVLDLLYFVIDILQFNGERNAYDEVDFDVMATETMDALRSYHETANFNEANQNHLILILDRKLHAFPWESIPYLQNVSVSRVGSMLTLRERILAMRRQMKDSTVERYHVKKQSGVSILNPSGDLSRTQTTMAPLLESLAKPSGSSWQSIDNRIPTAEQFATALSEKSMLLYFGHGSGNQYICKRAIKKLDKCAEVVWLMGCSSGSVTEYGDFEPTSVPLSYLIAGKRLEDNPTDEEVKPYRNDNREGLCMSVIATLWDVTDKDIDRFSVKVGEHWGLWSSTPTASPKELAPPKTPRKRGRSVPKTPSKTPSRTPGGRSRSRLVMRDEEGDRKNSLVEAVMLSRDACNLRYLNGAATVVYGVPVYLD